MRTIFGVACAALAVACSDSAAERSGSSAEAIHKGVAWPAYGSGIARLDPIGPGKRCSAVLIKADWILTARHCFDPFPSAMTATIGGEQHWVTQVEFHPSGFDAALLHLDAPFTTSAPRRLYRGKVTDPIHNDIQCVGYGADDLGVPFGDLNMGNFRVIELVPPDAILYGAIADPSTYDFGDSGGPCFYGPNAALVSIIVNSLGTYNSLTLDALEGWIYSWVPGLAPPIPTPWTTPPKYGDLNGDGRSDIFWRNESTSGPDVGHEVAWLLSIDQSARDESLPPEYMTYEPDMPWVTEQGWQPAGLADFDRDGHNDVLWHNQATGMNSVWHMTGASWRDHVEFRTITDPYDRATWFMEGTGDFDGDGWPDIVWRNYAPPGQPKSGQVLVWFMRDGTYLYEEQAPSVGDLAWHVGAVADFDNDGRADILWRHYQSGSNYIWRMNGASMKDAGDFIYPTITDLNWVMRGAGDYDGDGYVDILWRNRLLGQISIWYMNGIQRTAYDDHFRVPDLTWRTAGPTSTDW